MTRDPGEHEQPTERFSLRRWAQRKLDAARAEPALSAPATPAVPAAATSAAPAVPASSQAAAEAPPLPPVESLTIDSDFTLFMHPHVDAVVRRAALKQLFRDPRFNAMDGLDTYIDDYTKADPIPESVIKQLAHARAIFDPPATVVTPEGYVVDAPVTTAQRDTSPDAEGSSQAPLESDAEVPSTRHEGPTQGS